MQRLQQAPGLQWLTSRPIAHRGLHDMHEANPKVPENSLAAFAAAVECDYAIECDLQLGADGVPVVFHDDTLERLTARSGPIRRLGATELTQISLCGTGETIPTLAQMLSWTAGAVPLLLELKRVDGQDAGFAKAVADELKSYAGPVAVMTFCVPLGAELRRLAPGLPVGLVAEGRSKMAFRHLSAIVRHGFHFVSYALSDLPTPAPLVARWILGLPLICWTVRSPADAARARRWTDQMTFETIRP